MNPRNEFLVAMAHNFLHDSCFRNWLTEYRAEEIANALEELLALREEIAARRKADEGADTHTMFGNPAPGTGPGLSHRIEIGVSGLGPWRVTVRKEG